VFELKRNKHLIALALSFIFLLAVSVIDASSEESESPLAITDSAGRVVTLPGPAQGIIVLNTDAAEAVSALGASDLIVGLAYVYPGKPNGVEAVSQNLKPFSGIISLGLDFYKEENLSRELRLLGSILGREEQKNRTFVYPAIDEKLRSDRDEKII
jgi:iron complex transport system substrate-binding protein